MWSDTHVYRRKVELSRGPGGGAQREKWIRNAAENVLRLRATGVVRVPLPTSANPCIYAIEPPARTVRYDYVEVNVPNGDRDVVRIVIEEQLRGSPA